jgi:two-component system OmpR family sensor kinase
VTHDPFPGTTDAPPSSSALSSTWERTPLRIKLVGVVVLLATIGLVTSGFTARAALKGYLLDRVDQQLSGVVNDPRQLNDLANGTPQGPRRPAALGLVYVQFGDRILSPLPEGVALPSLPENPPGNKPFTVPSSSGDREWRAVQTTAVTRSTGVPGALVVAVPLDEVQRTVDRLEKIELVVGLGVLLLMAAGGYLVVQRSLRPLVQVERTAEAIAGGDLSQRVPESDPRTEVGSLSRSFNVMLGRIEQAFAQREASERQARASEDRMRRFVGDASHELRTPLTSIRGFAELYRQGALPTQEDVDRAMARVEDEASRMGLLVEDLLMLARLDQQRPLERAPVDLLELAGDAVQDGKAIDPGRDITLEAVATGPAPIVEGDEQRLRQVFTNLVSNALTHTPSTAPVTVRVSTGSGLATVEVVDRGPGIPPEDRQRVFERFYRTDASRTRRSGGSGLGLSIVSALVAAHGGRIEVGETPGGGATFVVTLPLSP